MSTIQSLPFTGAEIVSRGVSLILSSGYKHDGDVHEFHIKITSGNVHQLIAPIRFWELGFKHMHHLVNLPIDLIHYQDTEACEGQEMSRLGSGNFIVTVDHDHVTLRVNGYGFELTMPMVVYQEEILPVYEKLAGRAYLPMGVGDIRSGYVQHEASTYPVCVANNPPLVSKFVWTKDLLWEGAYFRKAGNVYQDSGKFKTWVRGDDGFWAVTARPITGTPFTNSIFERVMRAARELVVHEGAYQ